MKITVTECADNKSLQWGRKNLLQTVFFIGVDIQALVTFREKILKKKYRNVLVVSKKAIPLHSQSGKQLTVDK